MTLLPETLLSFQEKFPMIELDVRISGRYVDLVEEGIDVALRVGELEDSSLIARLLMPCAFHVCASPHYLQQHGTPVHPEDLSNHNCLVYSQSLRANTWAFKEKDGGDINIKINGNLHSDAGSLLLEAALKGNGIFIGPTYMFAKPLANGQLVTMLDEYLPASTGLYAVYPYTKLVSSKVRAFVDYLVETWTDLGSIK
jgi:DNA-binding transcriptional LysR family regulator